MDFLKEALQNEMVLSVICGAVAWLGHKAISWAVNKYPILKKAKLHERLDDGIAKIQEKKVQAAKLKGEKLATTEVMAIVDEVATSTGLSKEDLTTHRRKFKWGITPKVGAKGFEGITATIGGEF